MSLKTNGLFAADDMSYPEAMTFMRQMGGRFRGTKLEALMRGPDSAEAVIRSFCRYGIVFADAKILRIPSVAAEEVSLLASYGAHLVSVHAGDDDMLRACVEAYEESRPEDGLGIVVIPLLSSIDERTCKELYGRTIEEQIAFGAERASKAGAWGVVCGGGDLAMLKAQPSMDGMHIVVTSIRTAGKATHDQKRYATPAKVGSIGADYYVIGRQVRDSDDPPAEADAIELEMMTAGRPPLPVR